MSTLMPKYLDLHEALSAPVRAEVFGLTAEIKSLSLRPAAKGRGEVQAFLSSTGT